ncbi:MAG TPA: aldo/keto reductase [Candidatus Acidoferrales bacterium]|nr:aldo/keto reductase [Candidatus Acidoferrales bacterium]
MKYRLLGKTGLKVSELCLGTMTFGSKFFHIGVVNQEGANQMVARALEAGINFIDTADVYSFGESEEILARALKAAGAKRESVVIATKVMGAMSQEAWDGSGDVNDRGLSRKHIFEACEASLRRLDTDYIDLYQVHGWDRLTPMEEILRALDDLVRQGKVRYLGCSNWAARQLAKALGLAEGRGWERFVSLQAYYSLVGRDLEHELLPLCVEEGLGVLPWSPLAGGFLSGKYSRKNPKPAGARRSEFDFPPLDLERGYETVDTLAAVATTKEATIPQVALAWLLAQPGVASVILGAKTIEQFEDNLGAAELELTPAELSRLSALTPPPLLYPQWMIEFQSRGR